MVRSVVLFVVLALVVACSGRAPDEGSVATSRPVPCTEGAACTCGDLGQGKQTCRGSAAASCMCADGSETALEAGDPEPSTDAGAPLPEPSEGDTCDDAALAKVGTRDVLRGGETLFSAELEGKTDTFRSSCVSAVGPDVVQPLRARSNGTLVATVESTTAFVGTPVLYLKPTCRDTKDLACEARTAVLRAQVKADTTYFLHVDSVAKEHAPGARVTLRVTIE